MYDWPEVAWATDAMWRTIAERLNAATIAAPAALDRSRDPETVWRDPELMLTQVCGYPVAMRLREAVQIVATPIYAVEGCDGPFYSSFIVTRRDEARSSLADFVGSCFAFNVRDSLSGRVSLATAMLEEGLASDRVEWLETGGHRESILAVAERRADLAAIDAVCWGLAQRFEPIAVSRLRSIGQTPHRPAPPFITSRTRSQTEVARLRAALIDALASPESADVREALAIDGVAALSSADYAPLASLEH